MIVNGFLEELTGVEHDEKTHRGAKLLIELLRERNNEELFLYVDEVQLNESVRNVETVRVISERSRTPAILVGSDEMRARIEQSAQIVRRVYRPTFFGPLPSKHVVEAIPGLHPIYEGVATKLLRYVDSRAGGGNLGNWAKFSVDAVDLCDERGERRLTREIAEEVIRRMGGFTA